MRQGHIRLHMLLTASRIFQYMINMSIYIEDKAFGMSSSFRTTPIDGSTGRSEGNSPFGADHRTAYLYSVDR
jgi:hypothetical protein